MHITDSSRIGGPAGHSAEGSARPGLQVRQTVPARTLHGERHRGRHIVRTVEVHETFAQVRSGLITASTITAVSIRDGSVGTQESVLVASGEAVHRMHGVGSIAIELHNSKYIDK